MRPSTLRFKRMAEKNVWLKIHLIFWKNATNFTIFTGECLFRPKPYSLGLFDVAFAGQQPFTNFVCTIQNHFALIHLSIQKNGLTINVDGKDHDIIQSLQARFLKTCEDFIGYWACLKDCDTFWWWWMTILAIWEQVWNAQNCPKC